MQDHNNDLIGFHTFRTFTGHTQSATTSRRNKIPYLSLPPSFLENTEAAAEQPHPADNTKYYVNLNQIETATWHKILHGWSISDIAREERVSRQAILSRIRGNSKNQGGMVGKNFWVLLWWIMRQRMSK